MARRKGGTEKEMDRQRERREEYSSSGTSGGLKELVDLLAARQKKCVRAAAWEGGLVPRERERLTQQEGLGLEGSKEGGEEKERQSPPLHRSNLTMR